MEQPLAPPRSLARPSLQVGLVLAFAIVSGIAAWALLTRERAPEPAAPVAQARTDGPRIVTVDGLTALAGLRASPIYWAGRQSNILYEVTQTSNGYVYVRYLPSGTAPGDPRADYLTIGSYPRADAYGDVESAAKRPGAISLRLPDKGLAVYDPDKPTSIYFAYPDSPEQVEVYDPSAARALRLVQSSRVRPVP